MPPVLANLYNFFFFFESRWLDIFWLNSKNILPRIWRKLESDLQFHLWFYDLLYLYFSLTICAKLMLLQNLSIHKSNDMVMGENLVLPRKCNTACLRRTSPIFQLLWFDFLSMSSSAYEIKTHEENKINVFHLIHCVNGYYLVHYNCALRIKWISFTYSIPSRKCTKIIFPLK